MYPQFRAENRPPGLTFWILKRELPSKCPLKNTLGGMRGVGGHIRERSSSDGKRRYQVTIELERDLATGVRRQMSGGTFRTKREAQERVAELLVQGAPTKAKGSLGDFLREEWLPSKLDLAPASYAQYEWAMSRIIAAIGAVSLPALTAHHVQQVHDGLRREELSSRSRQVVGKTLRNALLMAVKGGYLEKSPADGVAISNGQRKQEIAYWSADQAREFLECEVVLQDWMRPLWQTALATGLRRGELCRFAGKTSISALGGSAFVRRLVCRGIPRQSELRRLVQRFVQSGSMTARLRFFEPGRTNRKSFLIASTPKRHLCLPIKTGR